jgi:hypothetical protein
MLKKVLRIVSLIKASLRKKACFLMQGEVQIESNSQRKLVR